MNTSLEKRLSALESRGGDSGTCWCVWYEPLDGEPAPPLLCPHGRPWSIRVVYDDAPIVDDDPKEGRHGDT